MAAERSNSQRAVLYCVLAIALLGGVSIGLLALTNGDPPQKANPSGVVASATPVPSSGVLHDQLLAQCQSVQQQLTPITAFTLDGVASIPAGAPKPTGAEVVSCALSTTRNTSTSRYVASEFGGTTVEQFGRAIEQAGWSKQHSETNNGLVETLYTLAGEIQIVVVDLGNGQLIAVYS